MRVVKSPIEPKIWHEPIPSIMRRTDAAMRCIERIATETADKEKLFRDNVIEVIPIAEVATVLCKGDPKGLKNKLGVPDMIAGVPVSFQEASRPEDSEEPHLVGMGILRL